MYPSHVPTMGSCGPFSHDSLVGPGLPATGCPPSCEPKSSGGLPHPPSNTTKHPTYRFIAAPAFRDSCFHLGAADADPSPNRLERLIDGGAEQALREAFTKPGRLAARFIHPIGGGENLDGQRLSFFCELTSCK